MVIAHKRQGIEAVYDLRRFDDEKRDALLRWEARLRAIVGAAENVGAPNHWWCCMDRAFAQYRGFTNFRWSGSPATGELRDI